MQQQQTAQGPWFDELAVGQVFDSAPAVTVTPALAAAHQAILGSRLRLALDHPLSERVLGDGVLAHPALVWDLAIGQSTVVTQHVKANLFYRGLVFSRAPRLGDTLHTRTEVVGLRQNRRKPGRAATGLAALRMTTTDQNGRAVLDFWRCAMLPLRDADADTGHADDLDVIGTAADDDQLAAVAAGWRLDDVPQAGTLHEGQVFAVAGGDVVSSAPELARLTLNIASVHHDAHRGGGTRLVYGGHTIGLALAQATRALPNIVTVTGWHGCDHTGPVHEGDTLRSEVTVQRLHPAACGGTLAHLQSRVSADGPEGPRDVLDWRFTALLA